MRTLHTTLCLALLALTVVCHGQMKELPQKINIYNYIQTAPAVSGDGSSMVYLSNYSNSGKLELRYTWLENGEWVDPVDMPLVHAEDANYLGGFSLNYDGSVFYFTSWRGGGIGNFDLWYSTRSGRNWSTPRNLGKPINSATSDAYPFLSPDDQYLYFSRCEGMTQTRSENCVLYRAKRKTEQYWEEPEALPATINNGHVIEPRILQDNKTLVFASNRPGGAGGLDLYFSRNQGDNTWSEPKPLSLLNTENNDVYVSIPAPGNVAYFPRYFRSDYNIVMAILPHDLRPLKIYEVSGTATDPSGNPMDVVVQVYDLNTQKREQFQRTGASGQYNVTVPEGSHYDLSIIATEPGYSFHSERLELDSLDRSARVNRNVTLSQPAVGDYLMLPNLVIDSATDQVLDDSRYEIQRLIRLMQATRMRIRAYVVIPPVSEVDSIPLDTLQNLYPAPDTSFTLLAETDTIGGDSLAMETPVIPSVPTPEEKMMEIAQRRAEALERYFISQRIPAQFFEISTHSLDEAKRLIPNYINPKTLTQWVIIEVIE